MAFDPLFWTNLASIVGGGLNSYFGYDANQKNIASQKEINQQNIDFAKQQSELARQWSLEDWNRTNEYNSPLQMMNRFRQAGINPHMVLGSGAQTTAAMIRGTELKTPKLTPPTHAPLQLPDVGGELERYYNLQRVKADISNANQQTKLLQQKQDMNNLDMITKGIRNSTGQFDLEKKKKFFDTEMEAAILKNKQTTASTENTQMDTKLKPMYYDLQKQSVRLQQAKTSAEISKINADTMRTLFENAHILPWQSKKLNREVGLMEAEGRLRQYDEMLRRDGLNAGDPQYMRQIAAMAKSLGERFGIDLSGAVQGFGIVSDWLQSSGSRSRARGQIMFGQ